MIVSNFRKKEAIPNHIILLIFASIAIFPLLVLVFNSVKPFNEFGLNPLGPPSTLRFENFSDAWVAGEYARIFFNSIKLVIGSVFLCLAVSLLAGFSLAKLNPRGSTIIAVYLLVGISIPAQLYILPLFLLWKELSLLNTHLGLIIIYSALNAPFATFLIRSYMIRLPDELFEASKLDGANTFQMFFRIAIPLSWPVILTAGLIIGLAVWNEFLFALTFITDQNFKPIATILFSFQSRFENNYALVSASAIMMVAPIAILFMIFQRRFISGLTSGGLKE
ncbi:carbohydrate ABC transporter permease [Alphaproteobacteria bacterium]|jgi:raffinose/stachyose/melibiose transport system permease protein|nr:carbohydrate ABC transporter permease [Alphaproteobacteria bacterium]|tara:strand:+ start:347 stop:1183 length:837 start_codon:yes stop_codon:yes gene_type:complete